jgi:CheY-like chemotaxis protein
VPHSQGETVLLVEDNAELRELCTSFLGDLGYRPLTADCGVAARDVITREPKIDLLLSDVVLPGGSNGPDVARYFAQYHPQGRVLFISGYTQDAFPSAASIERDGLLLRKPFTCSELAVRLREILYTPQPDDRRAANF